MRITANGKPYEIADATPLPEFLESIGLEPSRVIVERNHEALTPAEAKATLLQDEDSLEIVRIVAGG